MEKTQLIFLLGLNHSGKDTVGQMFVDKGYTRVAFGDVLKVDYAAEKGISVESLHIQGPGKEAHRDAIIEFAEAKRAIDPMYWIKKAIIPYLDDSGSIKTGLKLVFTDIRRKSEIDWIHDFKRLEFVSTEVYRRLPFPCIVSAKLFIVNRSSVIDNDMLSHYTIGYTEGRHIESDFPVLDAIIENNGTIEDLKTKVENCISVYSL